MTVQCISSEILEKAEKEADSSLENDRYNEGLEGLIRKANLPYGLKELPGLDNELALAYHAMQLFLKTYVAVRVTLQETDPLKEYTLKSFEDFRIKNDIFNLYSGFVAAREGNSLIEENSDISTEKKFSNELKQRILESIVGRAYESPALSQSSVISTKLVRIFNSIAWKKIRTEKELLQFTHVFLNNVKSTIEDTITERYENLEMLDAFARLPIRISKDSSNIYEGFVLPNQNVIQITDQDLFSQIQGDQQVVQELKDYLKIMSYYNPETQNNPYFDEDPYLRPLVVLLQGHPGSGKSLLGEAAIAEVNKLAKLRNCKAHALKLMPDDIFGPHVGESEQKLRKKLNYVQNENGIGFLFIDDADLGSMKSRSLSSETSHAFDEVQRMLMDWLYKPGYKGNYLVMLATNFIENLDPAIVNRSLVKNFEGATTPEELLNIFHNQTKQYSDKLNISSSNYESLGNAFIDFQLLLEHIKQTPEFKHRYATMISKLEFLTELDKKLNDFSALNYLFQINYFCKDDFKFSGRDVNKLATRVKNYIKNLEALPERTTQTDEELAEIINQNLRTIDYTTVLNYVIEQRLELLDREVSLLRQKVHERYKQMVEASFAEKLYTTRLENPPGN